MRWQGQHALDAAVEQAVFGLTELDWQGFQLWLLKGQWGYLLVSKHGGQLLQCRLSSHRYPLLWLTDRPKSAPAALRGGVPVCWPWFSDDLPAPDAPAHGLARTAEWGVADMDLNAGSVQLQPKVELVAGLKLSQSIQVSEKAVTITLSSHNASAVPVDLTQALHSYLAVSDAASVEVKGLADSAYVDKLRGMALFEPESALPKPPYDRIYQYANKVRIVDSSWQRVLHVCNTNSGSAIVWNPGEKAAEMADVATEQQSRFVCVEAGNVKPFDPLQLAAGASCSLTTSISVEAL